MDEMFGSVDKNNKCTGTISEFSELNLSAN
jgi:hypothetical protein